MTLSHIWLIYLYMVLYCVLVLHTLILFGLFVCFYGACFVIGNLHQKDEMFEDVFFKEVFSAKSGVHSVTEEVFRSFT